MGEILTQPLILRKKSRSSRFSSWSGEANSFGDKFLRGIYVFLLFAMDFVMFIYSINGKLCENGHINKAVLVICAIMLVSSIFCVFIFSFSRQLQNFFCALVTVLMTVIFFHQFGVGDVDNLLNNWFNEYAQWLSFLNFLPSPWMVGLILGALVYALFSYSSVILFVTLIILFSFGIGIQKNEFLRSSHVEHEEVRWVPADLGNIQDSNVIYLMMPKLPSYQLLGSMRDPNFRELRDLLVGFYAANNFEIYPNAFVQKTDTMSNIIDVLNQVDYTSSASNNRGYASFVNQWNFIHGGFDILSLEENRLYNYLHQNGFGVSMYAMPEFNFCLTGGDFLTDRCVIKGYKTVSVYDEKASIEQNVYALLGEWLLSIKSDYLKYVAKSFVDKSTLKDMKVLSANRRTSIEGSADIFEKLVSDYKRDTNGQFYLAYVDLPSDTYIYDEFCNIKPRNEWVALNDNAIYRGGIDEKRKAYVDQAKCLIGRLQEYMDSITLNDKIENTDIYLQGVSPIRELVGVVSDQYGRFVSEHLVNLAIRRGKSPRFLINANICLASDFTKTLIRYQDFCYTLTNMKNISANEASDLRVALINNSLLRGSKISNLMANYQDWFENYKANSASYQKRLQLLKAAQKTREKREKRLEKLKINQHAAEQNNVSVKKQQYDENIFNPTKEGEKKIDREIDAAQHHKDLSSLDVSPLASFKGNESDNVESGANTQAHINVSDDEKQGKKDDINAVEVTSDTMEAKKANEPIEIGVESDDLLNKTVD